MDDQKAQPTDQAANGQPADPMGAPAMPQMPPMPPMPTTDGGAGMNAGGNTPSADPMATPAAPTMDATASSMSAPSVTSTDSAPLVSTPGASTPVTLDQVMAELRKIEDKLVEMDEKL